MKGGENVKDNQRKEISIRNLKLSEGTSRNRCIHSRIDVRASAYVGYADMDNVVSSETK